MAMIITNKDGRGNKDLQSFERRRWGAIEAVNAKFKCYSDCSRACDAYAEKHGINVTFRDDTVSRYVTGCINLSMNRLKVLAAVIGYSDYSAIDEVFIAPQHRGAGYDWLGENGGVMKDLILPSSYEKQLRNKY